MLLGTYALNLPTHMIGSPYEPPGRFARWPCSKKDKDPWYVYKKLLENRIKKSRAFSLLKQNDGDPLMGLRGLLKGPVESAPWLQQVVVGRCFQI